MGDKPSWRFRLRNLILRQIETNVYEIELRCDGHHVGGSYVSSEEATNSYLKILKTLFAPLVFTNTSYDSIRDIYTFKTTVKENEINEFANSLIMVHNN